ncbi:MAG TPA: hypothetical protein VKT81_03055 [Bryobacteraceae bacterium]|nr:hypothetical protein [Bryobacteraceae bacterium]
MRAALGLAIFGYCAVLPLMAAVDGTVLNRTTGQAQANVILQLLQPGQGGMQTLGTAKTDATGKFHFDNTTQGPTLVQAIYSGVTYNKMIIPGTPSTGLELDVYDSSKKPNGAKISQHFIILQPTAAELFVSESFIYQGDSKLTFNDASNGTLHLYLPPGAKDPHVTIQGPGGMPIQRSVEKTKEPDIYKIDYPVKPGETRFDVNYSLPSASPLTFASKSIQPEGNTDLVAPNGVTLKGDSIELIGQEPKTQANIYRIKAPAFQVDIEGLVAPEPSNAAAAGENSDEPKVQLVPPRVYEHIYWILALTLGVLGLGSVLLVRNGAAKKGESE